MATIQQPRADVSRAIGGFDRFGADARSDRLRFAWARRLVRAPAVLVGAAILLVYVAVAVAGPWLAPFSYTEFHVADKLQGPSATYLFGTDQFGRDVLSRVIEGTRGILILAFCSTALGVIAGVAIGTVAGYHGGRIDDVLMRTMDVLMSFPSLLLAMLILTMVGPATPNIVVGIAVVFTPRVARVARSVVLGLRNLEYVEAARLRGESDLYVMTREILPNALGPIVVDAAIRVSYATLLGASLGFLGLGVQPPEADWGLMVSEARNFILIAPWMVLFPSEAIAALVVGANLFADGLARLLDVGDRASRGASL